MVLHVVRIGLIFEVFYLCSVWLAELTDMFLGSDNGDSLFLPVLGHLLGSFQQPGPTTCHLQLFPALAVSVISAPVVSISSPLRTLSCPLPSLLLPFLPS